MKADLLGQLIMTGVPGKELDGKTATLFRKVNPGAFILFGRNIESAPQLRKLIDDLRDLSEIEPIITIDQEGGRVSRLRLIGNEPPNAQQLRDSNDLEMAASELERLGYAVRSGTESEAAARHVKGFIAFKDPSGNGIEFVYRPEDAVPWAEVVERRSIEQHVVRLVAAGRVRAGGGRSRRGAGLARDDPLVDRSAAGDRGQRRGVFGIEQRGSTRQFVQQDIVHGRGVHSEGGVSKLKPHVRACLRSHRAVLAYVDAPPADGGPGAVYVLLRG